MITLSLPGGLTPGARAATAGVGPEGDLKRRTGHDLGVLGRRASIHSLIIASLFGCGGETVGRLDRLELEPRSDDRAVVLSVSPAEFGPLVVWDPRQPPPEPLVLDTSEFDRKQVTAMYYAASVDELGFAVGDLARDAEDGWPIPEPSRVQQADVAQTTAWRTLSEMPPSLRDLRVIRKTSCARFEASAVSLPFRGVHDVAAGFDGSAWVLSKSGALWRVTEGGEAGLLLDGLPVGGFVANPDGAWFSGANGALVEVRISGRTATVAQTLSIPTGPFTVVEALAVVPGETAPTFGLSRDSLFQSDGRDWEAVVRMDRDYGNVGAVLAVSRDEALFVFTGAESWSVFRWREGELSEYDVPVAPFNNGLNELSYVPSFGVVAGSGAGEILRLPPGDETWQKLEGAKSTFDIEDIEPYADGFVYTDETGDGVTQYTRQFAFCRRLIPRPAGSQVQAKRLAVRGLDLITAGDVPDSSLPGEVAWYRRVME